MDRDSKRAATTARARGPRLLITLLVIGAAVSGDASQASPPAALDRSVLPIHLPAPPRYTDLDVREATPPPRAEAKAPDGAPNVVLVLIDDMGFATPSSFGGPVAMPTLERLAQNGLRYNNFHTTALCSPTRAALKSGRNHHVNNMGSITEAATGFPGQTGQIPDSVAPVAEMLRLNGYSTAAFGKWHELATWETSVSGPMTRWPTVGGGFDEFYGFLGGETNQWAPALYHGTTMVELPADPDYHFTTDMTDKAVAWMKYQKAITPEKPFFVYFAPGATHAPHHVPAEWIARWKGKFDQGWDRLREETLARQIAAGVVPAGTKLARKPEAIRDWSSLGADEKRLFAKQAEVYAAFAEMTDHEIGRLVRALEDLGQLENTVFIYIAGDNGASAEGGMEGLYNESSYFNAVPEQLPDMLEKIDVWGSPETYPHMAAGWAVAFDTPFTWTKQVASSPGGVRNGMVIHWPKGIRAKNEVRSQFQHVIDVAPTILEAAKLPEPKVVNGVRQVPMQGTSMLYAFDDAKAKDRHVTQYFEIFGNRAIYHDGWLAGTVHKAPWEAQPRRPLAGDVWELYDLRSDFSASTDLAAAQPAKLAELQALFMREAAANQVLPIDDRSIERLVPALAGRPDLMAGRTSLTLSEGMVGMQENVFLNVKNKSLTITADVVVPDGGGNGTLIAQGGRFGGWSLYVKDGKPAYTYNFLGRDETTIAAARALPAGDATIRFDFAYDGGGPGKGGTGTLHVNGEQVAQGRIERTQPAIFSADETADVGVDLATAVVESVGAEKASRFTGRIPKLVVEVRDANQTAGAAGRSER
ncbi:MAG: arylsulfatase [Proteobacteria bacterium]|nr:MAG: arylsulfatase [Pseudomonadota bacterium]